MYIFKGLIYVQFKLVCIIENRIKVEKLDLNIRKT